MPECSAEAFYASSCLGWQCLDTQTQKAITARAMVLELAALGGTDYTNDLPGLLNDVAKLRQLSPENRNAAMLGIMLQNATEAGASVGDINQLRQESIQYVNSQDQLDNMILWLTCKLGVHATQ